MASSETVGEFLIKMGVDADGVDRKVNDVVNNIGNSINNFVTGVLAPAMAGLASLDFFKTMSDDIVQADRLSESLGMNIEKFSAWQNAAELAGVEAEEVASLFSDMNDWKLDFDLNDSGPLKDFIDNGLISGVRDANGEMKKTEDYILEIADALAKIDKEQANGLLVQMGVSDLNMVAWLQQGGDAIREQLELMKKVGTYSEEDAKMATEFSMSIKLLSMGFKKSMLPLFHLLAPILTQIAKKFGDLSAEIQNFIPKIEDISSAGENVAQNVQQAFSVLYNNIMACAPLLAGVGPMTSIDIFKNMATAIKKASIVARAFILSPWGIVLTSLLAIGVAVQEFIKWLNGGDSVLSSFFERLFGDTENAKNILDNVYNGFMDIVSKFEDNFSQLIPRFEELGQALLNLFNKIVDSEGFSLFVDVIISVIGFITTAIASFVNFLADNSNEIASIVDFIIGVFIGIVDVITYVVEAINSGITSAIEIFNTLGTVIEQIGNTISSIFNALSVAVMPFIDVLNNLYTVCNEVVNFITELVVYLVDTISGGISTIINLLYSLMDVVTSVGGFISGIFNSMASSFSSFVSSVISGASSVIGSIQGILNKLAELASNSLLGKILGSVGGSIYGALNNISSNIDNSTTTTNYGDKTINVKNIYPGVGNYLDPMQGVQAYL